MSKQCAEIQKFKKGKRKTNHLFFQKKKKRKIDENDKKRKIKKSPQKWKNTKITKNN